MKCKDPILCYQEGTKKEFRHFSQASPIFRLKHNLVFPCRTCIVCRRKNSYELAIRCVLHASLYKQNCFLTLTYDESKKEYHNKLDYTDIQKFKKRLRAHAKRKHDKIIQIFNVHEYGKNGKKHWHLVVFNYDFGLKKTHTIKNGHRLYTSEQLSKLWPHGFSTIGDVTEASALYQAQYTQKDIKNHNTLNDKKANSKHSGLGRDYFLKHYKQILELGYIPVGGKKAPIPRYFKKIAQKHYSHFYAPENFEDTPQRKKLFTKFKIDNKNALQPKKDLADLYEIYYRQQQIKIKEIAEQWEKEIEPYLFTKDKPDFLKSAENQLYDLENKNQTQRF